MANIASAKKRARQAVTRRLRNASQRSFLRSQLKKVVVALEKGDKTIAQTAYNEAVPVIDNMANKGLIHKNKAARHKSRLNKQVHALA
ncbi:MAG: 30S ribosomal protein S20 [Gammaproteobacteria bacterium]